MRTYTRLEKTIISLVVLVVAVVTFAVVQAYVNRSDAVKRTMLYQGEMREYYVYHPHAKIRVPKPLPLVIVLHGAGSHALNVEQVTGFSVKAEAEGFIAVYPQGIQVENNIHSGWNAVHCCGDAMVKGVDDVGFISVMVDTLTREEPVDVSRVYIVGASNGGMLAQKIAREIPHKITAVASMIAGVYGDESAASVTVPIMFFNDEDDAVIPFEGGVLRASSEYKIDRVTPFLPSIHQSQFWAKVNGCAPDPHVSMLEAIKLLRYDCPHGYDVMHYITRGLGHSWYHATQQANATNVVWSFFSRHKKMKDNE